MQSDELEKKFLVVGLGNPGQRYVDTRHNIGFYVIDELAKNLGLSFTKEGKSKVAKNQNLLLVKPQTYMNLSGLEVKRLLRYYKLPIKNLLVVVDDVALPFGTLRIKAKGSCGGHRGLESVQQELQTNHYSRLRVGVGSPKDSDMADYVLRPFLDREKSHLPEIAEKAVHAIELWLEKGVTFAMNKTNVHPKQKEKTDE